VPDFNPHLRFAIDSRAAAGRLDSKADGPNKGGEASIERYEAPQLIRWQTRPALPTDYENALGDALEALFTREVYELGAIVEGLNDSGPADPDGNPWTEASFQAVMKRLGDGEPVGGAG
jgi:Recombinase-like helix-turn-helix domain